jgi:hypothetical protein
MKFFIIRKTTTVVNNSVKTKTSNAWGNIKQATDRMGYTVNYTYHSSGQPKLITATGEGFINGIRSSIKTCNELFDFYSNDEPTNH